MRMNDFSLVFFFVNFCYIRLISIFSILLKIVINWIYIGETDKKIKCCLRFIHFLCSCWGDWCYELESVLFCLILHYFVFASSVTDLFHSSHPFILLYSPLLNRMLFCLFIIFARLFNEIVCSFPFASCWWKEYKCIPLICDFVSFSLHSFLATLEGDRYTIRRFRSYQFN